MSHNAVVLGGGGAKGSYEVGVWKALREIGFEYDTVVGSSVGSINGALMVQGDYEIAETMWKTIKTDMVFGVEKTDVEPNLIGILDAFGEDIIKNKGADATPLKELLEQYINEEQVRESRINYGLVTVSYPDFTPHYLFKEDIMDGKLRDFIMASSAFFPAIRAYTIDDKEYIDGGYYNNVPIEMATMKGADKIVAVNLKAIGKVKKFEPNKNQELIEITPRWDLGTMLLFNPEGTNQSEWNIILGYLDTKKAFSLLDGAKYTFQKGDFAKFVEKNDRLFAEGLSHLMPQNTGAGETALLYKIVKSLKKDLGYTPKDKPSLIMSMAETAGEIMNVSPYQVYSVDEFNEILLSKIETDEKMLVAIYQNKTNENKGIAKLAKEAFLFLTKLDRAEQIEYILSLLYAPKQNEKELIALASFLTEELITALYIFLIK